MRGIRVPAHRRAGCHPAISHSKNQLFMKLKTKILRSPKSIRPYSYYLEPGQEVFLVKDQGDKLTVTTIKDISSCIPSEDFFTVTKEDLE